VSAAWQFYIITLLVYFGTNLIAGWSLNLQYGVAGIQNFAFILFQSIGAYVAGVTSLGPSSAAFGETYILGATLPWPVPVVIAGVAGAVLALVVGSFALRPMSREFQAIVMIMVVVIASSIVVSEGSLLNGSDGIDGVPKPLQGVVNLGLVSYGWFYVAVTAFFCGLTYFVIHRITSSPYGRKLRAIRENKMSAAALGVNVRKESMVVFAFSGAIAAVSGALLVEFIGAWSPASWGIFETFLFLVALTVGGVGNNGGVVLGTAIVLTGILEGVQYLPNIGSGSLTGALQLMGVAVLIVIFLWFRPQGLLPERRRRLAARAGGSVRGAAAAAQKAEPTSATLIPAAADTASISTEGRANFAGDSRAGGSHVIVELTDVVKSFGGLRAVDGVSFEVREGTSVGLIGPNGAGKSTLINMIAGIEHPDSGGISLDGVDVSRWPPHRMSAHGLARTFQLSSEFARMTVIENVLVAAKAQRGNLLSQAMLGGRWWKADEHEHIERALGLLNRFGLGHALDDYAGELSGGQKRLLEISRALMAQPRVLLLDEPLAGIAPGLREEVEDHLMRLRDEGLTMILCEHSLETVERCTDTVVVMAAGRVLGLGTMEELRGKEEVVDAYLVG
jgi:branched-chain amino acid transport system permease protein